MNSKDNRPIGKRTIRDRLVRRARRGRMGQVYSAADTRLHRTVAIKVLSREKLADAESKRRFLQEALAASALNHPNTVTLYDIASDVANGGDIDYISVIQPIYELRHRTRW